MGLELIKRYRFISSANRLVAAHLRLLHQPSHLHEPQRQHEAQHLSRQEACYVQVSIVYNSNPLSSFETLLKTLMQRGVEFTQPFV